MVDDGAARQLGSKVDYLSKIVAIYKSMDTEQHFMAPRQTKVASQEQD